MPNTCAGCGVPVGSRAKVCSDRCRKRVKRGSTAPPTPIAAADEAPSGLVATVERSLTEVERLDTVLGQQAMALARRIDTGVDTGSSVAALSKELREVMALAMQGVAVAADPVDELMRRRELKRAAG